MTTTNKPTILRRIVTSASAAIAWMILVVIVIVVMNSMGFAEESIAIISGIGLYTAAAIAVLFLNKPELIPSFNRVDFQSGFGIINKASGTNAIERLSFLIIMICLPVILIWLIIETDLTSPFYEISRLMESLWFSDREWATHPIGWAAKGLALGLIGRFLFSPIYVWIRTGKFINHE